MNPNPQLKMQISNDAGTLPVFGVCVIKWRRSFVAHGSRIATSCVTFLPPFPIRERESFFRTACCKEISIALLRLPRKCFLAQTVVFFTSSGYKVECRRKSSCLLGSSSQAGRRSFHWNQYLNIQRTSRGYAAPFLPTVRPAAKVRCREKVTESSCIELKERTVMSDSRSFVLWHRPTYWA